MGERVVASPFLEREYVSEFRLFPPRKPSLGGPSTITFWERTKHPPKAKPVPGQEDAGGTVCNIPPGRGGDTVGSKGRGRE